MLLRTPDELGFDPNQVTPGWIGFTATALVGLVIILLLFDFNRRVRRINNRAEAKERIEAELAARDAELAGAEPRPEERSGGDAEQDRAADLGPPQGDSGRAGA
ncbi:hypothetical protein [Agrococcus lahaulensis]|uniref:hypothetical protein n=1 Tax=Agrococcus lahaulensis TaxID=341722 RepID=UPI000685D868|nr:hypothetical protein [Agrococcus lahaulensis]